MENSVFWANFYNSFWTYAYIHRHSHKLYSESNFLFIRSQFLYHYRFSIFVFVCYPRFFFFVFTSFHCPSSPFRHHCIWVPNHRNVVEWWWFMSTARDPTSGYIWKNYTPWTDHSNTIIQWICLVSTIWSCQQGTINVPF